MSQFESVNEKQIFLAEGGWKNITNFYDFYGNINFLKIFFIYAQFFSEFCPFTLSLNGFVMMLFT